MRRTHFLFGLALAVAAMDECAGQQILAQLSGREPLGAIGDVNADGVPDFAARIDGLHLGVFSGSDYSILYGLNISSYGQIMPGTPFGDIDLDGNDDFITAGDAGGGSGVAVWSGRTGSVLYVIGYLYSNEPDRMCVTSDLNGDGIRDIVVALSTQSVQIVAYSGSDGSEIWTRDIGVGIILAIAPLADLDGDSVPEIAIADALTSAIVRISGADGAVIDTHGIPSSIAALCSVDDIDDDGYADLAVGRPFDSAGTVTVYSGQDWHVLRIHYGVAGAEFGRVVVLLGDVSGDGIADYAVGAPGESGDVLNQGAVHVFSAADGMELFSVGCPLPAGERFGGAISSSDFTGDGLSEMVVASQNYVWVVAGPCPSPPPANYCIAAPNSVGSGAVMSGLGSRSITDNSFMLSVAAAPPGQPGLFFYGGGQVEYILGNGYLCVAGGGKGVYRLSPQIVMNSGYATRHLDFTVPPAGSGPGQVLPGATWNFQFWYRDPQAGGAGYNLSDGMNATFCP